jgi:hypothetical protein
MEDADSPYNPLGLPEFSPTIVFIPFVPPRSELYPRTLLCTRETE